MSLYSDAIRRAQEYAIRRGLSIEKQLGGGIQGVAFATSAGSAVKAHIREDGFAIERDVYLRLAEHGIDRIDDFWAPKLVGYSEPDLVIEMEIDSPPFVLDFAGAYLDHRPPYADDRAIMSAWEAEKREQFEERWPIVRHMMAKFRSYGIYLSDIKPGNVEFGD